jgi:Creatinine amidohydrolase
VTALGDLTGPEAERLAAAGARLAVSVGSTEQHGPLLPLSTDTDVAVAQAVRLAARREDVVVALPVWLPCRRMGTTLGCSRTRGAFEVRDRLAIEALGFAALAEQIYCREFGGEGRWRPNRPRCGPGSGGPRGPTAAGR